MIGYSKTMQTGKSKRKKNTQTQINKDSNKVLDKIYKAKKKYYKCELRISPNCLPRETTSYGKTLKMTYHHRHKRDWYKEGNRMGLLKTFNQTIRCCIPCHDLIEPNKQLTAGLFRKHRPHNKNIRKEK